MSVSSLNAGFDVRRSGTGVLTIGKEIGYEALPLAQMDFDKSKKDLRVLFINPPVDFSVFYSDMDLSDTKSSSPPIGILHLASMAREYGYPVKVVDAHADGLSVPQLLKVVAEFQPQVICITAMTIMIDASAMIAKAVKEYFPHIITMIGGVHLTAEPSKTLEQYPQFDFGVVGEGELVLIDFLDAIQRKRSWDSVQSLVWRADGHITINPRRSFFKNLDEFPFPAFDLVGERLFSHYRLSVFGTKKFRSVGLVTSRGCTGMCTFCVDGETLVQTDFLKWKLVKDVVVGELLLGVDEMPAKGKYRKYQSAEVLALSTREAETFEIVTDKATVIATAEHPWLTGANRWRTTADLKSGWTIRYTSPASVSPEETQDYRQGYICGALKSDGYFKRYIKKNGRIHHRCAITGDFEMMETCLRYAEELGVPLKRRPINGGMYKYVTWNVSCYDEPTFWTIEEWFENPSPEFNRGFLAGFFDGDGSWTSALRFHGLNLETMNEVKERLARANFRVYQYSKGLSLLGGDGESIRFLGWAQPKVYRKWKRFNAGVGPKGCATVLSVTPVGRRTVYNFQTSTKTFIANGLITHNCDLGVVGRGYRFMTAPYLINHLKELNERYQVNDLLFYDDMFTGNRKRLEAFCQAMIEAGTPFTWSCCSRVDFVSYLDLLKQMKAAGCHTIEFGVESGCQRILDSMRKNTTKEKVREVISRTTDVGIITKANFILGHLGETHDSIRETIRFASSLNVNYVQHTHLVPLPGSEIYETAGKHGTFDPSWSKMNTLLINFIPYGFTRKDLVWYSKVFWRSFYLRPKVIWQEVRKIASWEDVYRLWLAMKSFVKVTVFRKVSLRTHSGKVGLIH